MTDQGEHVVTPQESALYEAMTAGDWDTVEQLRAEAQAADPTPPDPLPEDWLSPAEQFDTDYAQAYARYQRDHEPPEEERVENTEAQVQAENVEAMER